MKIKYCVLSIDGGGVRGIIPATFLKKLEELTGKPTGKLFDLIIGTSTGGLIAIAAANDFNSDKMLDLYLNGSSKIFPSSFCRTVESVGGLAEPKYDRSEFDKLLVEYFGDKNLSEAKVPIAVTSYDLEAAGPMIWSSSDVLKGDSPDAKFADIAGATSAAPTYFSPKEFYDGNGIIHHEIDGGMFLNNPQMLALNELLKIHPEVSRKEILLISMGTGNVEMKWDIEALQYAGILGWIKDGRIIEVMMDGNTDFADQSAKLVYPNHFRLQPNLKKKYGEMDNTSPENLQGLQRVAEKYINQNDATFNKIAELLMARDSLHEACHNSNCIDI